MSIAAGVLLAAAVVLLVALPFLREPVVDDDRLDAPDEAETRHLALLDERDRALSALKELEFDHRTGKITDADYRELVGPLRRSAATALRGLERRYGSPMTETPELPPEPSPPPDEGTPPTPAPVPEPYPPPDEATIPQE
jgi:hypothetical protein